MKSYTPAQQIAIALGVQLLGLVLAGGFLYQLTKPTDEAADRIINGASLGVLHLSNVATESQVVDQLVAAWAEHPGESNRRTEVDAALDRCARAVRNYASLGGDPGTRPFAEPLGAAMARVSRAVEFESASLSMGRVDPAGRRAVSEAASALGAIVVKAAESHASEAGALASRIQQLRRESIVFGAIFSALVIVVATVGAALIWRTSNRASRMRAAYVNVMEQRAAELELFAGRVAHDIRSPLSAVRLGLELVDRRGDASVHEPVARGFAALARADRIVEGLLSFAKAGAPVGHGILTSVSDEVRGVVEQLAEDARRAGVSLVVEPLPPVAIECREGILSSILTNLVGNAIKYMGDAARRRVEVRVQASNGWVRVEVADTGPGVSAAQSERIFEPWFRGHASDSISGLGLGLATVRRLVQAHGGRVGLEPTPGGGATFWFELPIAAEVPSARLSA